MKGRTAQEKTRKCSICGQTTNLICADCRVYGMGSVHVCDSSACQDQHDLVCPETYRLL